MLARRRLARLLAAAPLAGCASGGRTGLSRLQTPRSLSDLLVNVKEVTRSGAILEDDFYTSDNLKRVFGGTVVDVPVAFNGRRTGADVRGFPAWKELKGTDRSSDDSVVLSITRSFDIHGGEQAVLLVTSNGATELRFDGVERVLGRDWHPIYPMVPLHGPGTGPPPGPPATSPHGNERIQYQLAEPRLMRSLQISFAPDGTFQAARAAANQY